jgi:anti-repressor protein
MEMKSYNKKTSVEAAGQLVQIEKAQDYQTSFDQIRQVDQNGNEFWSARDLQKALGYKKFQDMEKAVLSILDEMQYLNELTLERKLQVNQTNSQNPKAKFDYILSRLACYKLAMRGETDDCKKSRTYFSVQIRKQELAQVSPKSLDIRIVARQLLDELDKKDQIIAEQKPAVEFTLQVKNSINSVSVSDFAKVLGTGEIRLYTWLREQGFLQFKPKNRPYQNFINDGYFKVIEKTYPDQSTGETRSYFQTLITGKGQIYLTKKWLNQSQIA